MAMISKIILNQYLHIVLTEMSSTCTRQKVVQAYQRSSNNICDYYLYRAFGGPIKIVYSTRFVTRTAVMLST